jgi:RNA 2',3'-cyclic 3'-phosphodiesterase
VPRTFVAVRLPDVVLDAVALRVSEIAVPGRRTTRDQWHLTLQFLGDDVDVGAVIAALDGIDAPGGRGQLGGGGAFPDATHARVFWLGLLEGTELLAQIAHAVAERTAPLGHEADPRPFRPHLTLARCRDATDLRPVIAAVGNDPIGPAWHVDAITVYESKRLADGARYTERARIPLKDVSLPL